MNECFMCNATSEQTIIHRVMVDSGGVTDPVFVCDTCYRTICEGKDHILGNMWVAWKEGVSSGYSWSGLATLIRDDLEGALYSYHHGAMEPATCENADIYKLGVVIHNLGEHNVYFLAAISKYRIAGSTVIIIGRKPIPFLCAREIMRSRQTITTKPGDSYVRGRWLFSGPITTQPWGTQVEAESKFLLLAQAFGQPPDPFLDLANRQTRSGYELIRRGLL